MLILLRSIRCMARVTRPGAGRRQEGARTSGALRRDAARNPVGRRRSRSQAGRRLRPHGIGSAPPARGSGHRRRRRRRRADRSHLGGCRPTSPPALGQRTSGPMRQGRLQRRRAHRRTGTARRGAGWVRGNGRAMSSADGSASADDGPDALGRLVPDESGDGRPVDRAGSRRGCLRRRSSCCRGERRGPRSASARRARARPARRPRPDGRDRRRCDGGRPGPRPVR